MPRYASKTPRIEAPQQLYTAYSFRCTAAGAAIRPKRVGGLMVEERGADHVEKRLRQLEEEVRGLKEPLEKTLLEVREILNTLENPFTYITALLREEGTGVLTEAMQNSSFQNKENKPTSGNLPEKEHARTQLETWDKEYPLNVELAASSTRRISGTKISRFINVVAAVSLMLNLVGREQLLNIINMASWRGLISKQLADDVKEALELYLRGDLGIQLDSLITRPSSGVGNTLVVLYILSRLENDPNDSFMLILMTAFERSSPNQNGQRRY